MRNKVTDTRTYTETVKPLAIGESCRFAYNSCHIPLLQATALLVGGLGIYKTYRKCKNESLRDRAREGTSIPGKVGGRLRCKRRKDGITYDCYSVMN